MSKRRERAKAQSAHPNNKMAQQETNIVRRIEQLVELGKFFIDLAKLIFGGVILTVLLEYMTYKMPLLATGLISIMMFVILGFHLISYANKK